MVTRSRPLLTLLTLLCAGACNLDWGSSSDDGEPDAANDPVRDAQVDGSSLEAGPSGSDGGDASSGNPSGTEPLGSSCEGNDECASGHCADAVCCDSACDGICESCSSAGLCQMPAHDAACAAVTCPNDTACRDHEDDLTADLCASLGQCKTSADCSYTDQPDRTPCGDQGELCEAGVCVNPTTLCGGTEECDTFCCERLDMGARSCAAASNSSCGASNNVNDPDTGLKVFCDEQADCPTGQFCCVSHANNMVTLGCSDTCGFKHAVGGAYILCESTAGTSACPSGETCTQDLSSVSLPAGWHVCTVP